MFESRPLVVMIKRRLSSILKALLVVFFVCIALSTWLTYRQRSVVVVRSDSGALSHPSGRRKDDGNWFVQTKPFNLFTYSAFYDNRWSRLHNVTGREFKSRIFPPITTNDRSSTQVIVVAVGEKLELIRHCCLFYDDAVGTRAPSCPHRVPAKAMRGYLIACRLPVSEDVTLSWQRDLGGKLQPRAVSLSWGDDDDEITSYRVPVEPVLDPNFPTEDRLQRRGTVAVCVNRMFGDALEPSDVIEWFEMQRLLGVEHVVLYNHSVSDRLGRTIQTYSDTLSATDHFRLELRQIWPFGPDDPSWRSGEDRTDSYQRPGLTDCYYRLAGRYKWIVVIDLDELIVPQMEDQTTLQQLIDTVTKGEHNRFGEMYLSTIHFFRNLQKRRNVTTNSETIYAPSSATYRSYFVNINQRWEPLLFGQKAIHDADACVAVGVHTCEEPTEIFSKLRLVQMKPDDSWTALLMQKMVPESVGLLHHYRRCCHLDIHPRWGKRKYCQNQPMINDDIIERKYGRQLESRLGVLLEKLNIATSSARFTAEKIQCPKSGVSENV